MPLMLLAPDEARPAADEGGLYDPQQAGLAALFARLRAGRTASAKPADTPVVQEPAPDTTPS